MVCNIKKYILWYMFIMSYYFGMKVGNNFILDCKVLYKEDNIKDGYI